MRDFTTYREMATIQSEGHEEMNRYTAECRKAAMIHQAKTGESALEWIRQNGILKDGQTPAPKKAARINMGKAVRRNPGSSHRE